MPNIKRVSCSVDGCGKKICSQGLCRSHYVQFRRLLLSKDEWKKIERKRGICKVLGCGAPSKAKGLCQKHRGISVRKKNRAFIVARYFKDGIKCLKCNREYPLYVIDFHHPQPSAKDYTMSEILNNVALDKRPDLIAELDKCEKMCGRCHQNLHHNPELTHESTYEEKRKGRRIDRLKKLIRKKFGSNCIRCGSWLYPKEMEFHHRDAKCKEGYLSDMFRMASEKVVLREVAKCDIVCRNCHRIIHMAKKS